jgi:hypothetical protein
MYDDVFTRFFLSSYLYQNKPRRSFCPPAILVPMLRETAEGQNSRAI